VNFKLNGLIQSQQWPIGFGPYEEIVAWDQGDDVWVGEEGDSPYPLDICPLDVPLDWAPDDVEDEDPSFAIFDSIEEDFHRVKKGTSLKIKGRRKVLNLESSIDYGDASMPSRKRKGKAPVLQR
jgi:hypothetical protein